MKFSMIQNAQDSLEHAVDNIVDKSRSKDGNLKRVIQGLSHVVELILKERLSRDHPAFIFTKIDAYPSKDAFTVNTDLAVKRLERLSGVVFDDQDKRTIDISRKKRNEIEHFEIDIAPNEAEVLIGRLLSFILEFSSKELELDWQDTLMDKQNWKELTRHSEFWKTHSVKVLKRLENEDVDECPGCGSDAFEVGEMRCQLCGHKDEYIDCIGHCGEEFLAGFGEEVGNYELCPHCVRADAAAYNHEKY